MAEDLRTSTGAASATNNQHQNPSLTSVTGVTPDTAVMSHPMWTPHRVEERLRKAVALQTALRTEHLVPDNIAGRSLENRGIIGGIGPAGGDDGLVAHAAEALAWLRWLEPDDDALVRARLAGAPWKSICWRFGISRPTADRRYRYALALIVWHLNGHRDHEPKPSLRSLLGMSRAA